MEDLLTVETQRVGDVGIITATGEVDMTTARLLRDAVREVMREEAVHLILDVRKVDYMDSTGMSVIMTARKLTSEVHGKVYLITRPGEAARALELVKTHHLVEMADTPEEALQALGA